MARLNRSNVLCHFSHSGVDDIFEIIHAISGLNNFFADNGLEDGYETRLYFPADGEQMKKVVQRVYGDKGLRFIFSTRSKLPRVLDANGNSMYGSDDYTFVPGKDEVVREGTDGYIITFGDALYRALDAVERAREAGINVGLINKVTLNVCDHEILQKVGKTKFVLVVESYI